jgi:hypothetical protein
MSEDKEEYEDELVTSHSDENPELAGRRRGPLAAYSTEGSAVSDLYKKDHQERRLGVRSDEHVIDYDEYIPPEE